ncbi:autoinducer binding domain-containing protein [Vibrio sp. S4M6]|uniref:autoinducer binding domain-containing protein n=1 Tax=Vibrio sinus TaxID=2946865 RepID=UPI002029EF40|nr:autoinducer binding domain-containing protein [Vibrio sinus]MCL9780027.1 autoinducer binding domain-containing protein [Vibrio sinus]
MSFTDLINQRLGIRDTYIAIRLHNHQTDQSELVTNIPDDFRNTYYEKRYNDIDDSFSYTEQNIGKLCFPNTLNPDYESKFLPILESHGFFNLASFSIGDDIQLTCIITQTKQIQDAAQEFLALRDKVIQWCSIIVDEFCELADSSHFDFNAIPKA